MRVLLRLVIALPIVFIGSIAFVIYFLIQSRQFSTGLLEAGRSPSFGGDIGTTPSPYDVRVGNAALSGMPQSARISLPAAGST
jgi:hypothetical protein